MIDFGERIKLVREGARDSQKDMADKLGVTAPTVKRWETNQTELRLSMLIKFCEAYDVEPEYVLGTDDVM